MPVKNTKRRTNDGLEGVITGLTEEEKKVLEDAGIGGGTAVEANPQEEATQQLNKIKIDNIAYNIAVGNNIAVTKVETKDLVSGSNSNASWVSDRKLEPNTAYNVGDIVAIKVTRTMNPYHINSNQILVQCPGYTNSSYERYKLTFGDVVLAMIEDTSNETWRSTNNEDYTLTVKHEIAYMVIKAGTTGDSTSLYGVTGWSFKYRVLLYTLGPVTA